MEVSGRVKMLGNIQEVSPTFKKREIVVTTDEQYPQHILVEFAQDNCDLLNGIQLGEQVKISINLRGREWVNPQGETKYFNQIQGWKIVRMQQQQPNYGNQPQQVQPNYANNTQNGQQGFPPPPNFNNNGKGF